MRFDCLTKDFGKFDLQSSALVVTDGRRAAPDLESVLQTVFSAPAWRIRPELLLAKNARLRRFTGDNEWYRTDAIRAHRFSQLRAQLHELLVICECMQV